MVILRHTPPDAPITGWFGAVDGMTTSVEEIGTPPHQLEAVFQSGPVVPSQVPVAFTVKLELAGPVVVPSLAVIVVVSAFVSVVASIVVDCPLVKLTAVA